MKNIRRGWIIFWLLALLGAVQADTPPYLSLKNVRADSDTIAFSGNEIDIPWHCRNLRIEFKVLPKDSSVYWIRYSANGSRSFSVVTQDRFLEFQELTPHSEMDIRLDLLIIQSKVGSIPISHANYNFRIQKRPPPVLKLRDVVVDEISYGSKTDLVFPHGAHQLNLKFDVEPEDYPLTGLFFTGVGPGSHFEQAVSGREINFSATEPGEYRLLVTTQEAGESSTAPGKSKIQVRIRVKAPFFEEHTQLVTIFGILLYFLFNYLFAWLIVRDGHQTHRETRYWVIFTLFASIFGYLAYKIYTTATQVNCPECGELISPEFKFCPFCQTQLKDKCPNCGATVQTWMHYCTACGAELPGKSPVTPAK